MKDKHRFFAGLFLLLLFSLPCQLHAAIYKWYDEQGKVHYTQAPPPKGSKQTNINSDTFNSVKMRKVPAGSIYKTKPRVRTITKRRTIRRSCRNR